MSGRLGHIDGKRRVGHVPRNGIRPTNYAYGAGGVIFWLNPETGLSTYVDGANISSWIDKITNLSFNQSTGANQPIYRSSDVNFNNLPVVEFQSSDGLIQSNGFGNVGLTVVVVYKNDTNGAVNVIFSASAAGAPMILTAGGTNAGITGIGIRAGSNDMYGTTEDTNAHIAVLVSNKTSSFIMVDGVVEATGTMTFDGSIERISTTTTSALKGKLAELITFEGAFSQASALLISNNLNAKYAIY